jgi:hypothetical protein
MTQIEVVSDGRFEPIEVRNRPFQPTKCLAQPRVDCLEGLDIGMLVRRLAHRFVLSPQLVEQ